MSRADRLERLETQSAQQKRVILHYADGTIRRGGNMLLHNSIVQAIRGQAVGLVRATVDGNTEGLLPAILKAINQTRGGDNDNT